MRWKFALVAMFACATALAQRSVTVDTKRLEDKSVQFTAVKDYPGRATVALTFKRLVNSNVYDDGIFTVGTSQVNLLRLRPLDTQKHIDYSYSYRVFYGDVEAEADTTFVYRLPVSSQKLTKRRNVVHIYDRYLKKKERQIAASVFDVEPTDTIYAARKGVVVRVETAATEQSANLVTSTVRAEVRVEHADGSLAFYTMLNPHNILVREGQTVYPDTPIGFPWSFDGDRYVFFFEVCDYVWVERGVNAQYQFFVPLFKTDLGVTTLRHGVEYRAVVDNELIEREMSNREKKRRHKK